MSPLEELLAKQPDIRPLHARQRGYLQVLVNEFALYKRGSDGLTAEIQIGDDTLSLTGHVGKRSFNETVEAHGGQVNGTALADRLRDFFADPRQLAYRFDCSSFPLRYANGGVLPVIHLNGVEYFCLFYRDVFPIGWNIANGASDNLEEMLDPGRIIAREFGEELLVFDASKKLIYAHDPGDDNRPPGFQKEAVKAWGNALGMKDLVNFAPTALPLKWIDGPDQIDAAVRSRRKSTGGYFLSVTPEDGAIEVDKFGLINLSGDVAIIDGEITGGVLLNRIVGLFEVQKPRDWVNDHEFSPDLLFVNGRKDDPKRLTEAVAASVQAIGHFRDEARKKAFEVATVRFNLCPIARRIIQRYFEWAERATPQTRPSAPAQPPTAAEIDGCQVFISYKFENAEPARWLYDYLKSCNPPYRVFCSNETLGQLGESDYFAAINRALGSAACMVVFGTNPDHFRSGWVEYEWKSFLVEMLSKRKKAELFTFVGNVAVSELPFALRSREMIPYSSASPLDSFANLERRIRSALNG